VNAFARGLDHPRWLYVLPNGDVLVAETNAPPRPLDAQGLRGWFFKRYQKRAGGAVPSANRITLLRDADGDGVAELKTPFTVGHHDGLDGHGGAGDAGGSTGRQAVLFAPRVA
jgi:glucose/arabinose dehydrogenase